VHAKIMLLPASAPGEKLCGYAEQILTEVSAAFQHSFTLKREKIGEKSMAAYKAKIGTVIIPNANKGDLDEVDDAVKETTNFVLATKLEEVLDEALVKN